MSNLLKLQRFPRPDQPQPVYTGALTLWEAVLYPPIGDAERNVSPRSEGRARFDVRLTECAPEQGWTFTAVDAVTRTWMPAVDAEMGGFRVGARPTLDVRWPTWEPQPAWLLTNLPATVTTAQLWPGILENLGLSYRSGARLALDVRGAEWAPEAGWLNGVVDATVATWAGIFGQEAQGFRTPARGNAAIDATPQSAWMTATLPSGPTVDQTWPAMASLLGSGRLWSLAPDRRPFEPGANLAWVPTIANQTIASWAGIWTAQREAVRANDRAKQDVRSEWAPEFTWVQRVVEAIVAKWAPVFNAELGYRSDARRPLNVRIGTDSPELAWLAAVVTFTSPATVSLAEFTTTSDGEWRTTSDGLWRSTGLFPKRTTE